MLRFYFNSIIYAFQFYWSAKTKYKVHSPFLYALIEDVFDNKKDFYAFSIIELMRKKLLCNHEQIEMIDFGAGSRLSSTSKRRISEIAQTSLSSKNQCQVLFRIINRLQPNTIIELGSSLGISTLYLSMANKKSDIYSFEGNPSSLAIAKHQANFLGIENIHFIQGPFNRTLEEQLHKLESIDFAFIDGNHQYAPTISYFLELLKKSNEQSIFIFDDIHWSAGMKRAWKEIRNHKSVKASITVYDYGIVLFDTKFIEPKHINLIPVWMKSWELFQL